MIRIAICDDEKKLRKDLHRLVAVQLELIGLEYEIMEFGCGERLLEACGTGCRIDLLFLDIEMPGLGGMATAKLLRRDDQQMMIVFVTAYPDFVFQGYEVQAFHYILKPYEEAKLREVLQNAVRELTGRESSYYVVEQKSASLKLPVTDICYFKSDRRIVKAVTKDQSYSFYGKLDDVEADLPAGFQRVHNRYLVNMRHVARIDGASCLCAGEELPVSRAYKQALAVAFAKAMLR